MFLLDFSLYRTNQALGRSSCGKQDSLAGRRRKSRERSCLGLFLSANEKYKHTHFPTTRAGTFLPNHPIPASIVRRQVSFRTICRVVKVLPFGCILRHRRRSLQHVGISKSKNLHSILNSECTFAPPTGRPPSPRTTPWITPSPTSVAWAGVRNEIANSGSQSLRNGASLSPWD